MLPIKYTLLKEGIKITLLSRSGTCPTLGQHTPHTHNPTLNLPDGLQPALTATFHPHEEQDVTQRVTLFTELFVCGGTGRNREGPGHRGKKQRGKMLNPAPLTHTPPNHCRRSRAEPQLLHSQSLSSLLFQVYLVRIQSFDTFSNIPMCLCMHT